MVRAAQNYTEFIMMTRSKLGLEERKAGDGPPPHHRDCHRHRHLHQGTATSTGHLLRHRERSVNQSADRMIDPKLKV